MPRYKLTIEYNGTPYAGWQKMPGFPTIQESLMNAIHAFCGEEADVVGAGRTDSGVHAKGQVAHVDLSADHKSFTVMSALNYHLQMRMLAGKPTLIPAIERTISVIAAEQVSEDFHARFSATGRHYRYRILSRRAPAALHANEVWHVPEKLNIPAMREAAAMLVGTHDFTSFRDTQCQAKSAIKTMDRIEIISQGDEVEIHVSARSFLHHMIRNFAGSLKLVGTGRWQPEDLQRALEARDRTQAGPTAPPQGLCFMRVDYDAAK